MSVEAGADVAFVGCGRIARAMVQGLVSEGYHAGRVRGISRTGTGARALSREFGTLVAASLDDAVRDVRLVVIATHPHETEAVLQGLADCVTPDHVLVSLVASWRTEAVAAAIPGVPVIRAVPNVAVAVRTGMTVLSRGPEATHGSLAEVKTLFGRLGHVVTAEEDLLEAVSAVSGAGPALIAYFTQALAAAGVDQGLDGNTASLLAAQAVRSTGALLDHAASPQSVIDSVRSPGGMTAAALRVLQERGVAEAARDATAAAVRLSYQRTVTGR